MSVYGPSFSGNIPVRLTYNAFTFRDRTYSLPRLYDYTRKNPRTLLNDDIITFYLCDWLLKERFDEETRISTEVYNTLFFTHVRKKLENAITAPPRRSELYSLHKQIFRRVDANVLKKELLVMPIHLEHPKHWILVLIHNPKAAVRRKFQTDINNNSPFQLAQTTVFDVDDNQHCRILIMDSLIHEQKYKDALQKYHKIIDETLRMWLMMVVAASGEEMMASKIKTVVCQNLVKQNNSYDCGLFVLAYAEYFSYWNRNWMNLTTKELEELKMDINVVYEMTNETARKRLEELFENMENILSE